MADVVMRSVLVTGAYGLLGSWLTRALLDRGARVAVLRRDDAPASALTLEGTEARCTVVRGDVRDLELLDRVLGEEEVDTVFHLAAQTIVGTAQRSPLSTWETNVRGTWVVLEACRRHGVQRVVVASSDKAYGSHDDLPYREDHELRARFPYDASKACADIIARSYFHSYGLPVAVTRFANLYGGGDLNASRLIPETLAGALSGRAPVIRSDGSPERDFLYVEDAVAAYLAIAGALDGDGARGEAFNAGSGRSWPVREVVELVCRAAGADVEPDIRGTGTPDGEIDRQWVDPSRLRALPGWAPAVELAEGLERTVAWYRRHSGALAG
ncbi:MAG: NAD-dependent epimerase/dehydratase family protein [Solirubrobacteraceae bacterium]